MIIPALWFSIAWVAWLLSELVGAIILPAVRRGRVEERGRADQGSGLLIVFGVFATLVAVSAFRALGLATLPLAFGYLGIALVVSGVVIRQWSIAVLGRYFSVTVRTLADHRVIEAGPYRYVRHPSYTGAIVSLVGLGLLGGSWEGTLVILLASAALFAYRIHVEEKLLLEQLGPAYAQYQARTKRLIPFVV